MRKERSHVSRLVEQRAARCLGLDDGGVSMPSPKPQVPYFFYVNKSSLSILFQQLICLYCFMKQNLILSGMACKTEISSLKCIITSLKRQEICIFSRRRERGMATF